MAIDLNPQQLGLQFGSGAVIGGIIGFAAKKVAKLIAVLVGIEMAVGAFLESRGIITVDWNRLSGGIISASQQAASGTPPSWLMSILSTLSVGVGFTGGFLVGFRRG